MKYRDRVRGHLAIEHSHTKGVRSFSGVTRREFLGTLGALGVAAAVPASGLAAQTGSAAKPTLGRIDVHHHLYLRHT